MGDAMAPPPALVPLSRLPSRDGLVPAPPPMPQRALATGTIVVPSRSMGGAKTVDALAAPSRLLASSGRKPSTRKGASGDGASMLGSISVFMGHLPWWRGTACNARTRAPLRGALARAGARGERGHAGE